MKLYKLLKGLIHNPFLFAGGVEIWHYVSNTPPRTNQNKQQFNLLEIMKASYKKSLDNYLPVIVHADGRRETLYGAPLVTIKRAKEYARFEIYNRLSAPSI